MMILQTLLAFVFGLSVLIVVHELGHYFVARLCDVKVLRFSLGMGKILFSRSFGPDKTEWAFSLLPIGGYVKLLDARVDDLSTLTPEERKREFTGKSVWSRMAIVAAGPFSNFLLAIVLLAGLYMYGVPEPLAKLRAVPENTVAYEAGLRGGEKITGMNGSAISSWQDVRFKMIESMMKHHPLIFDVQLENGETKQITMPLKAYYIDELDAGFMDQFGLSLARPPAVIQKIVEKGPAEKAGLQKADHITHVNGKPVIDGVDLVQIIRKSPGMPLVMDLVRDGKPLQVKVVPDSYEENDSIVGKVQAEIPIVPEMVDVQYGFFASFGKGIAKAWQTSALTLKMVGKMFTGDVSVKNITGPVTIADYAGKTARAGLIRYLYFIAFISISIGVMNLLPIPVLDGGLLLYYAVEAVSGHTVSERMGEMAQRVGLALLVILLAVAVFNDVSRLLG